MLTRHTRRDEESVAAARLTSVLDAAAAPAEQGPAPGEDAALAAFRASSVRADGRRSRMHMPTTPIKALGVAAASAGLLLTGGFAAASAGVLPGAAQDKAADVLENIGIVVPGANEHSADHAETRGRSTEAPPTGDEADGADTESANRHGKAVSEVARSDEFEGSEKGEAVSQAARSNDHAGQHGSGQHGSGQAPGRSATGREHAPAPAAGTASEGNGGQGGDDAPPVETPKNGGGTGTADDATAGNAAGASTHGTGTAEEKSGERSTAGSGNASDRPAPADPH